jgi:prevent-host-death family protein
MFKANVFDVKARLSEYLDRAAQGERIVICRHNKPVAELRPVTSGRTEPRPMGPLPGRPTFDVPSSFFEPLSDEELDAWEGMVFTDPDVSARTAPSGRSASKVAQTSRKDAPARRRRATRRKK